MSKKIYTTLLLAGCLLFTKYSHGQLYINGATFTIESGATVTVQGNITSNVDILGAGKVLLSGSSAQTVDMNNFSIPKLEINNVSNATLISPAKIASELIFTNGNLILGTNDLTMANAATITTPANNKFVVTNGTGKLVKTALAASFAYPIGNTALTYNPVTIVNSGIADNIAVRALTNAYSAGLTGSAFTKEVVDATWDISEAVNGGSNLSITASWNGSDELPGFKRAKSGISQYITTPGNVGWDLLNNQVVAASGSNPYTVTRTGVMTLGAFAVGNRPVLSPLLVSPKVFLQGPYSTGTGYMTDNLRLQNLIPLTEPYDTIPGFGHLATGSGGGETTTAAIAGSAAPASNDAIVDWVFVQLHNAAGVVINTRSVLLQRDGDLVETDGTSGINMAGTAAGNYFISIRHRNHLGVRSSGATLPLSKTTTTPYNFTTGQSQAFNDGVITNQPMADIGATAGTVFGMYGGNVNVDKSTRKTGSASLNDNSLLLLGVNSAAVPGPTGVYRREDLNMDGNVRRTGSATTNDASKILAILNGLNIITQSTF